MEEATQDFAKGDKVTLVVRGKTVRGEVLKVTPKRVQVAYEWSSESSRSFSLTRSEGWRTRDELTLVPREPGEGSPGDGVGVIAGALRENYLATTPSR